MLTKMRQMLKQQEGFTLMELMIVVVIIGILAGIAVPVYKGLDTKAKEAVGKANAAMLNHGVRTMETIGHKAKIGEGGSEVEFKPGDEYSNEDDQGLLLDFLGIDGEEDPILHVKWGTNKFEMEVDAQIPEKTETQSAP